MLLVLVLLFAGCNFPVYEPVIEVKMSERFDGTCVEIVYAHHYMINGNSSVTITDVNALDRYQKQVEFLSIRLKEAREKMPPQNSQ